MPFTTNKRMLLTGVVCLLSMLARAQENTLSNNPYSLYGLGQLTEFGAGKTNGLGTSGLAIPSDTFVNTLNPASLGAIPPHAFFFDFGGNIRATMLKEQRLRQSSTTGDFSNLAIAFALSKKSGVSLALTPYSTIGYLLKDITSSIQGNDTASYNTTIEGSGGINNLTLAYGHAFGPSKSFRLGVSGAVLFGQRVKTETNTIPGKSSNGEEVSIIRIHDETYYHGLRLGAGLQYDISKGFALGAQVNFPTLLTTHIEHVVSSYDYLETPLKDVYSPANAFKLPLEVGVGLQTAFKNYYTLTLDYKRRFWKDTNSTQDPAMLVDSDIFSLGVEYTQGKQSLKFLNTVAYRAGVSYNTGYLEINQHRIKSYALDLGFGIPLSRKTNTMINVGYSYGVRGQKLNDLIQETYHLISINISLEGHWFEKNKIL